MGKLEFRGKEFDCAIFDSTTDKASWPSKVQENKKSATGYSYGTLEMVDAGNGHMTRDGFEIPLKCNILTDGKSAFWLSNEQLDKKFVNKEVKIRAIAKEEITNSKTQIEPILSRSLSQSIASKASSVQTKTSTSKKSKKK